MLLTSTQVIPRWQREDGGSALLLRQIEELNKNTVLLIADAGKLIQESKQLSERIRSFEHSSAKPKPLLSRHD
jgi:hypothetical protein